MLIHEDRNYRQRLETLFTDIERLAADPLRNTPETNRELEDLRARLEQLEAQLLQHHEQAILQTERTSPHGPKNGARALNPVLFENDQVGFVYAAGSLEPLEQAVIIPKHKGAINMPFMVGGQPIGEVQVEPTPQRAWKEDEVSLVNQVAQQASLQIQTLRLLASTEQARAEAESASRRFIHESWDTYLNAIQHAERIGYAYDQASLLPHTETIEGKEGIRKPIAVMGEQIGTLYLQPDATHPFTDADATLITEVANQVAQQVETIRLLADASRARAEAEEVSRALTRENWQAFIVRQDEANLGFVYDNNRVLPVTDIQQKYDVSLTQPIVVRGESIGQLAIAGWEVVSPEAVQMASAIASQVSAHLENLRLLEQAEISRVEAEKSQEQFELAVQGSNDGLWDWDIANESIYYSPRWKSMLGYEEHELTRGFQEWEDLIHPDDRAYATKSLTDYLEQRAQEYDVEVRLRHKDGSWIWVRDRGKALRREDGTPYRMAGAHTDITQRKLDAQTIAERANQLETVATVSTAASTVLNPDALLQQVVDLTKSRFDLYHAQMYELDEDGKTLLLASGAGTVGALMIAAGHAIDMGVEQSLVARTAREQKAVIINDVLNEPGFLPNPLLPNTRAEMAIPMMVGDKVLGVFDVQSENINGFTKEDADIYTTLAAQVAVALQNARRYVEQAATVTQLRELDRLKSSFLANMSHELRTPLNSILGFSDVILEGLNGPLTANMDNDIRLIQKNGQHLLHLINDVLDMAKIESGKMNLNLEKFKVHRVFDEVTSITFTLASEKNLSLLIDETSDQNVEIFADNTRLRQVMINLVNNAIKFTEAGKIVLSATPMEGARVLISVIDTGIGISHDELEAVFQEFTQVDTSTTRKAGGTGLGLPISRRLVEMHGGRLWAESTGIEGEGSTFYVELPLEARITEVVEKQEK